MHDKGDSKENTTPSTPSTALMMNRLENEDDFEAFLNDYEPTFIDRTVAQELDRLLRVHLVMKNEAVARSGIDRTYGYHILNGNRRAGRDKLLRFAIGIGLTIDEAQHLLLIAKEGALYPKVIRDAAVIFCINRGMDIHQAQFLLDKLGVDLLE